MLTANAFLTRRLVLTLSAGFGLSLMLLVALTFIGLKGLAETDQRLKHIVRDNTVKTQLASQMREVVRDRAISMLSIVVMGEPFEKDQEMIRFYQLGSTYQTTRQKLEPMLANGAEKALLQEIDSLTRNNQPLMVKTIELGMDGYTFLAFEVLQREGIPMQRQLVKQLNTLISMQQESTRQAAAEAEAAYVQTRGLMIGLGLLAATIAALVATLVIRRTARLSAETESERTKYHTLFETNTEGIVLLDDHGFTDCNAATLEMFHVASVADFVALQPEDLGAPIQAGGVSAHELAVTRIRAAVEQGHAVFEWRGRRGDGSLFDAEIALHAMRLNERPYIQAIIRDVSPQKEAERALKTAHDAALAAAELKSQFVANVSHEIRTPLNGILGMTGFLLRSPLAEQQKEYAETIHYSAEALLGIINDLLDFSKIEAGRLSLEHIVLDLPRLLRDVIALYAPRAEAKGLRLILDLDSQLDAWVIGDPLRLRQILLNLLDNAIKFTEQGEIRLEARTRQRGADLCQIRLSVRDAGIGIPEAALNRIFQAFSQADGSTSRKYGGTGLGLAISRQLAELMGGTLSVDSQPGEGSAFHLDLPMRISVSPPDGLTPASSAPVKLAGRILVAEDNPVNQKVTRYMLENLGLEAIVAGDGKEAFALHQAQPVDLILMDCQMPEWDGFMATHAIRDWEARDGRRHTPIIALTANAMPGYGDTCRSAGMDEYLAKPLREEDLLRILQRFLGKMSASTEPIANTPQPDDDTPGFDLAKVRKLCRDDPAQVREMLALFIDSTDLLMADLGAALARRDGPQAARQAHQIKGAAAYLGVTSMTQLSSALEADAKQNRLDEAARVFITLQTAFDGVRQDMKSLM
jgi:signal transduction histidine kinase/HPt (histidine-containing phosphotransfer) domain-containing protein/ActR/RegA family two-component response regulator